MWIVGHILFFAWSMLFLYLTYQTSVHLVEYVKDLNDEKNQTYNRFDYSFEATSGFTVIILITLSFFAALHALYFNFSLPG